MSPSTFALTASALAAAGLVVAWPPERPSGTTPTPEQLAWQDLEYGMFVHFSINTFNDMEWSDGTLSSATFNPTEFDPRQWTRVAKDAGMKYLVFTAKHHDGFCTWPSAYTDYSVRSSPWRDGQGDCVREVADACREAGLRFGIYLSPWDRHEPSYADNVAYDRYYTNQMRELLTNYGDVMEWWCDGAGGEGHVYDWAGYYRIMKQLQPSCLQAIAGNPDIRWVGNEDGLAPGTLWNVVDVDGQPYWWPAECDVPLRRNWFWHTDDADSIKSLDHLLDIYHRSVGHGAGLLLNVAPDRRGLIPEADAARVKELWDTVRRLYRFDMARTRSCDASTSMPLHPARLACDGDPNTYWRAAKGDARPWIMVKLGDTRRIDRVVLEEDLPLGQHVSGFRVQCFDGDAWTDAFEGTTIGHKRIAVFPAVRAQVVRVRLRAESGEPALRSLGVYLGEA